jgi:glycosyltransferase involved in cell wall biosynthesis
LRVFSSSRSAIQRRPYAGRIKVLITVPFAARLGGAENMLWAFLRHVDGRRLVPVVVFLERGPFEREVADLGVSTLVREAGRLRDLPRFARIVRQLAADLRRECPNVVLDWMAKTHLYAAPAAMLAGMSDRLVWWQHVLPTGHWVERLATTLPARAVGTSSHAAAREQDRLWPRRRTFVVHPGIDAPPALARDDAVDLRRALGLPTEELLVGCVGRLEAGRKQKDFVRAVATLRRRGWDVHGIIVGGNPLGLSGGYAESLRRLAAELELAGAVTFTGHVPEASPYIAALDVLVQPGPESFGIAVLEAMASGVPVVAVNTGGAAEIIEPGRSGLLVTPGHENKLVHAVERLMTDHVLRERLRDGARDRVRSCFAADRMAEELQRHLEEIGRETGSRRRDHRSIARR